jgi:hypothetical protein
MEEVGRELVSRTSGVLLYIPTSTSDMSGNAIDVMGIHTTAAYSDFHELIEIQDRLYSASCANTGMCI